MMNSNKEDNFEISLTDVGKKFNKQWIFKNLSINIKSGDRLEVQGSNGSGKSTFLQILSGFISPSHGSIVWKNNNHVIQPEAIYKNTALAAPYIELIEQFTVKENVDFFLRLKPFQNNISINQFLEISELTDVQNKPVKNFSSGMKQRLKLALAVLSDTELLLLDEPLSNLDSKGYDWYQVLCNQYINNRLVIVCSNKVKEETGFCNRMVNIELHKPNSITG